MMCKMRRSKMLNRVARLRTREVNLRKTTQNKTLQDNTNLQWAGEDSNLRRLSPADLQSAPFSHSGTDPINHR